MDMKPNILKLWLVHMLLVPIFIVGLWIFGIPMDNKLILLFLVIVFPLFTFMSAVIGGSLSSIKVDKDGLTSSFPFANRILWREVQSIYVRWPYIIVKSRCSYVLLPGQWLLNNYEDIIHIVRIAADSYESPKMLLALLSGKNQPSVH